jgi:hypothetical protein
MSLAALEDAFVARLAATFAGRVKEVDHRPERLDEAQLARMLSMAPAAYVAILGLTRRTAPEGTWDARFGVYLIAANASGEPARRRGDAATIGAYEMAEVALRVLDGWAPEDAAGAVEVTSLEALDAAAFDRQGRTVWGLVAEVAIALPRGVDPATDPAIAPFVTLDIAWDIPPLGNVPAPPPPPPDGGVGGRDAGDRLTLEQ